MDTNGLPAHVTSTVVSCAATKACLPSVWWPPPWNWVSCRQVLRVLEMEERYLSTEVLERFIRARLKMRPPLRHLWLGKSRYQVGALNVQLKGLYLWRERPFFAKTCLESVEIWRFWGKLFRKLMKRQRWKTDTHLNVSVAIHGILLDEGKFQIVCITDSKHRISFTSYPFIQHDCRVLSPFCQKLFSNQRSASVLFSIDAKPL